MTDDLERVTSEMLEAGWSAGKSAGSTHRGFPAFDLRAAYLAMRSREPQARAESIAKKGSSNHE